MMPACSRSASTSVHHSCQTRKQQQHAEGQQQLTEDADQAAAAAPAVGGPHRITVASTVSEPSKAGQRWFLEGLDLLAQPHVVDPFAVHLDARILLERGSHLLDRADHGDLERRGVARPLSRRVLPAQRKALPLMTLGPATSSPRLRPATGH